MAKVTAVIDIGSNSARIAVYRRTSRFGFYLLREEKSRIRISEGSYQKGGNLQEVAIERAIKALGEFLGIARSLKARKILAVATSAVRDAPNRSYFLSRVRRELGLKIKVIDGQKEGFLGGVAVANLLYTPTGLAIDIGGGSTELAVIENRRVVRTLSLKLGTVRLKELFFDKGDYRGALNYIFHQLKEVGEEFRGYPVCFGIGGTIRAFSKIIIKKTNYPLDILHGFEYSVPKWLPLMDQMVQMEDGELLNLGVKPNRLDTIREGIFIFSILLRELGIEKVITSGVGVREGVFLADLLRNSGFRFPGNFNPSVRTIIDVYNINTTLSTYEVKIALELFDLLKEEWKLEKSFKTHLKYGLKLSRAGNLIDFYDFHKHTDYILLNSLHYGFSHSDRLLISKIIRLHKKERIREQDLKPFASLLPPVEVVEKLSFLFWVAKMLNIGNNCPPVKIEKRDGKIVITGKNLYLARENLRRRSHLYPIKIG